MYDLIIIGGGPAAISAGIYAARKRLKILLITKDWGGQVSYSPLVENYPGIDNINGIDLVNKFVDHLKKNDLEIKENIEVKEINVINDFELEIKTEKESFKSKTAIISTGRIPTRLNIPGEEKFFGKGISSCATCDAPLFVDKVVVVVGGANTGMETALELSKYASKVYILKSSSRLRADEFLEEKARNNSKIEIIDNVKINEIKGDKFVTSLVYKDKSLDKDKELSVQGIFLAIGSSPNSSFIKDVVELNKEREIKINLENQTSKVNIFAAGDVTDVIHNQVIIAAGEGAKATLSVYEYLKKLK